MLTNILTNRGIRHTEMVHTIVRRMSLTQGKG